MRNLFILRGAPGSGKSTWIKENNLEPYTLSTDALRLMYQSPVTTPEGTMAISQNNDTAVWALLMELLERRMSKGEFIIIDATHYKSSLITKYKDLVSKYRYRVNVIDFSNVEEQELLRRNKDRGFRTVPEEVITKMVVALKDVSEVKKSYKILTPQEAINMINSNLIPFDANEYEKVVVFGDIHGCYDPLKEYFDNYPFSEKTNYIFCGDYLDRGLQNKEVLQFLISLKDKPNCMFIEGNHEGWIRLYAQKDYDMEYYESTITQYRDPFITKIISQLRDKQNELQKKINRNNSLCDELHKLLKQSWEVDADNVELYYQFEKINVPETQKQLRQESRQLEQVVDKLAKHIAIIQHEEHNTKDFVESCCNWYQETFGVELCLNIGNILEKNYNVTQNKKDNPIKSLEFIKRTYPQIKDVDKTEIRKFCDKLAQMSYFTFGNKQFLVTHAGIPCMPTIKTPTIEMIKGVGKYEQHEEIDNAFIENVQEVTPIHGHRNTMRTSSNTTIETEQGVRQIINLEGQVEFGGHLRILELSKVSGSVVSSIIEIKNNNFVEEDNTQEEQTEKTDLQILKELVTSKLIQVKELDENIISLNFTRDAFYDKKWNNLTCTARGLFVDKTNGNIVCRSFSKFFNHKERPETETAGLKQNFVFPVIGYKKENGFLATISKYNGQVRFFTKSTNKGDFVNWFIGVLCDHYNIYGSGSSRIGSYVRYSDIYNRMLQCTDLDQIPYKEELRSLKTQLENKLSPYIEEGYSYVFECIDKDNDPHIIKYKENNVYLLQVFKNQLKEEHVSWRELHEIANKLIVPCKSQELRFDNWEQFNTWKDEFTKGVTQWNCKHEGYVFEDANGFQVKFKSSFYKYWKQMRAVKELLQKGKQHLKIYKTKEEIQTIKLLESYTREQLQELSIIDIQQRFYQEYEV